MPRLVLGFLRIGWILGFEFLHFWASSHVAILRGRGSVLVQLNWYEFVLAVILARVELVFEGVLHPDEFPVVEIPAQLALPLVHHVLVRLLPLAFRAAFEA